MSNQDDQDSYSPRILRLVLETFGVLGLLLTVFVMWYYYGYSSNVQNQDYSLTFADGGLTFDSGKYAWAVNNNGDNPTKIIKVYLAENITSGKIFASTLSDKSGKNLEFTNIKFNESSTLTNINLTSGWMTIRFDINDYALERGSFQGWIILSAQENNFVPITISTKPILEVTVSLVLIGVFSSICIWEIIRYYKNTSTKTNTSKLNALLTNIARAPAGQQALMMQNRQIIEQEIIQNNIQLAKYDTRNRQAKKSAFRISLIESVSALVGVTIGLFTVLNDTFVTGVLNIDVYETIILLGIGLGAGSLKELVDD